YDRGIRRSCGIHLNDEKYATGSNTVGNVTGSKPEAKPIRCDEESISNRQDALGKQVNRETNKKSQRR
ncbi:MAG TPA: hypothetical protein VI230_01510, partial [Ignavibacteriaceae bacterium]